jgi:hypothetical protein
MRKARSHTDLLRLPPVYPLLKPILNRVLEVRNGAGPDEPLLINVRNSFVKGIGVPSTEWLVEP